MLAFENFFLQDLQNMITETFVTELNKTSTYGLISFSGETKTDNKIALISLTNNKLKFNLKKTLIRIKQALIWVDTVHDQTSFRVTHDHVLNFGVLSTQKIKQLVKKEQCRKK